MHILPCPALSILLISSSPFSPSLAFLPAFSFLTFQPYLKGLNRLVVSGLILTNPRFSL